MNNLDLRSVRQRLGWSEQKAAHRLGVSQSYLSMLENGKRRLTKTLARRVMNVFGMPATVLPPSSPARWDAQELARQLAALDYPGFAYLQARGRTEKRNPAEVLLSALTDEHLEARLVEALPWLLLRYWNIDQGWLVEQAKVRDLQNRLGFVATLARRLGEKADPVNVDRTRALSKLEATLSMSKLAKEDTLGKPPQSAAERNWVLENRTEDAKNWNILNNWRPEHFQYVDV
jgi:transcriptional regulator with XRE-family HTH domain